MKILLTKTLPNEEGLYYWSNVSGGDVFIARVYTEDGELHCDLDCCDPDVSSNLCGYRDIGYWAKVDQSMFQLCESEQERREIIQKQHSNDTHRAVDIDRPEPECKCDSPDLVQTNASDHGNTHICLNCVGWSKGGA